VAIVCRSRAQSEESRAAAGGSVTFRRDPAQTDRPGAPREGAVAGSARVVAKLWLKRGQTPL